MYNPQSKDCQNANSCDGKLKWYPEDTAVPKAILDLFVSFKILLM